MLAVGTLAASLHTEQFKVPRAMMQAFFKDRHCECFPCTVLETDGGFHNKGTEVPNAEKLNHAWVYKRINNNNVSNPVINRRFMLIPALLDGSMAKLHSLHPEPEQRHCVQFRCFTLFIPALQSFRFYWVTLGCLYHLSYLCHLFRAQSLLSLPFSSAPKCLFSPLCATRFLLTSTCGWTTTMSIPPLSNDLLVSSHGT